MADYQQTVLGAFQEVEGNLAALRVLREGNAAANDAVAKAKRSVELFTYLYEDGADPYLNVVTAQTTELLNERN